MRPLPQGVQEGLGAPTRNEADDDVVHYKGQVMTHAPGLLSMDPTG